MLRARSTTLSIGTKNDQSVAVRIDIDRGSHISLPGPSDFQYHDLMVNRLV